jgi:hypothetical protein
MAAAEQSRAEMERTPHALGFGIAGRVWNHHQGMEEALLSQQYGIVFLALGCRLAAVTS